MFVLWRASMSCQYDRGVRRIVRAIEGMVAGMVEESFCFRYHVSHWRLVMGLWHSKVLVRMRAMSNLISDPLLSFCRVLSVTGPLGLL
jgi:hypothetical protein